MNQITGIINEEWRSVSDYPTYQVSNLGRVRNSSTGNILKNTIDTNGYHIMTLYQTGRKKKHSVHRLVAQEFIPNPENKLFVDHIDRNKTNNTISNLRWCTHTKNTRNRTKKTGTSSKYIGVYWDNDSKRWWSEIKVDGKTKTLIWSDDEREAARAYDSAALLYFGLSANLNDISDDEDNNEPMDV